MTQPGIVEIHGKQYRTVAHRIAEFREEHPDWTIQTELVSADDHRVVMRAEIGRVAGTINEKGEVIVAPHMEIISTGYAEEERGSSNINKTSALENAETSAVGRALAFLGLAGTEIASADEVVNAISQQREKQLYAQFTAATEAVETNHEHLVGIRDALYNNNFDLARELWNEVTQDDQLAIWRATTKGGWFSTRERQQMKWWSNEFEVVK